MATVPIDGLTGEGAHVTYDPTTLALYVTQPKLGLAVVDARTRQVLATLSELAGAGLAVFDRSRVYVATGPSRVTSVSKQGWHVEGDWLLNLPIAGMWVDVPADRLYVADQIGDVHVYAGGPVPQPLAV
jgi:hypothetical protein